MKPELSKKNEYWLPKHRYYELKYFCLQYPYWKSVCNSIDGYAKIGYSGKRLSKSSRTEIAASCRDQYIQSMKLIERTAYLTDNGWVDLNTVLSALGLPKEVILQNCNYNHIGCDVPDEKATWVEEISGESIDAYEKEIIDAEYHFNRNFTMRGYASLNELYEFLGMPQTEYGKSVGWTTSDGIFWVDFEHRIVNNGDDGGPCVYSIWPIFELSADYLEEWT